MPKRTFNAICNRLRNIRLSTSRLSLLVSVFFVATANSKVIKLISEAFHGHYLFILSTLVFLVLFNNLLVFILGFRYLFKPWLVLLTFIAAASSYFMQAYGVVIDETMIQNVVETDQKEAFDLLTAGLFFNLFVYGVLPALLISQVRIQYRSFLRECLNKVFATGLSLAAICAMAFLFYGDYASLIRNNHQIRDDIVPMGPVYAAYSFIRDEAPLSKPAFRTIGEDASPGKAWSKSHKKVVSIIVVGETARAQNFSLGGYQRNTNPELQKQDIIYFNHFSSCGTSTAISLPCMFALEGRSDFDVADSKHSENLLDVLQHAGLPVLWRNNNSGCKGICYRANVEDISHQTNNPLCKTGECFDEVLLENLQQKINAAEKGIVIVLHQKGSHGPAYYKRVPEAFQVFKPFCKTSQLQQCSSEELVNAYDNTILYTDHILASLISFLDQQSADIDTSLLYVSDHGESLGENHLYLHGMPYAIAPSQQTHVPFVLWFSAGYLDRFSIDKSCVEKLASGNYSHDNFFHSVLGMLDIKTAVYAADQDIFHSCRTR